MNNDAPRPLLQGDFGLQPDEFIARAGLTRQDLSTLLDEGLVVGAYDVAGNLRVIQLEPLPTLEQLQGLDMTPVPDYPQTMRAGLSYEPGDQSLED